VEIATPAPRLLVRFETTETAAVEQAAHVATIAVPHSPAVTVVHGAEEEACWRAHHALVGQADSVLLRVNVVPTRIAETLASLEPPAAAHGLRVRAIGRALLGALLIAVDGDAAAISDLVHQLRATVQAAAGHVAVLSGPAAVTSRVPVWDDLGAAAGIMRAVKAQFDPHGTLCPGGGPGGLA